MRLEVQGLKFGYSPDRPVLDGISFSVGGDGIFCILGRNGTGKSTLLKCLVGEERAEGTVLLDGKPFSACSAREVARKIGYLPQNHVPRFPFRVLDVVMMGRTAHLGYFAHPGKEDEEIARRNMEFLSISHLCEQPYTNISGGERQLVLIAAALTQEPEFLLMDEPTSHLDFGNSHRFLELVERLHDSHIGILMTTHFPEQALFLNAETFILKGGHLQESGRAEEVIRQDSMEALYELPVHIRRIGNRTVCIGGELEEKDG